MHPIRNTDGRWARNNEQKANRFAEHLENTFQPNEGDDTQDWEDPKQMEMEIRPTTPKEIAAQIKGNINPKKAPEFDLITGEVLQ